MKVCRQNPFANKNTPFGSSPKGGGYIYFLMLSSISILIFSAINAPRAKE